MPTLGQCPICPGEPCRLCQPGSQGPESCGKVWLVMTDPELRSALEAMCREARAAQPR